MKGIGTQSSLLFNCLFLFFSSLHHHHPPFGFSLGESIHRGVGDSADHWATGRGYTTDNGPREKRENSRGWPTRSDPGERMCAVGIVPLCRTKDRSESLQRFFGLTFWSSTCAPKREIDRREISSRQRSNCV